MANFLVMNNLFSVCAFLFRLFNCQCRTWIKRRVVYTKEVIAISSHACKDYSGTINFDVIPMFQIKSVCELDKRSKSSPQAGPRPDTDAACESSREKTAAPSQSSEKTQPLGHNAMEKFANSLEIKTSEDGLNCGRSYHLKVKCAQPSLHHASALPPIASSLPTQCVQRALCGSPRDRRAAPRR
jgi:hypothetical protein